ncbi:MAG: hypothetical protein AAFR16_04965 [Pseudomonadota bacterium]
MALSDPSAAPEPPRDAPPLDLPPFDFGGVLSQTFSVFWRGFPTFFLLGLLAAVAGLAGQAALLGPGVLLAPEDPDWLLRTLEQPGGWALFVISSAVLPVLAFSVATAMIVQAAYDVKLERPLRASAYVAPALTRLPWVVLISLIVTIAAALGMLALIVPGLYVYALFSVSVPAIMIERRGFDALARSARLTKGYRWPVLGLLVVILVIASAAGALAGLAAAPAVLVGGAPAWVLTAANALMSGLTTGLFGVAVAIVYARLRELKEGLIVGDMANVFS